MKRKSKVTLAAVAMLFAGAASAMTPGAFEQYVHDNFPNGIAKAHMTPAIATEVSPRFGADGKTIVRTFVCAKFDSAPSSGSTGSCGNLAGNDQRIQAGDRVYVKRVEVPDWRSPVRTFIEPASVTNSREVAAR